MKSILVVDDDENIRMIVMYMLEREGYHVIGAKDGKEAQEFIDGSETPDMALFDVMMPYMDGFELLSYARAKQEWSDIPIIMLTAKSQETDIVKALDNGASDYITKPFKPNELLARMRRHL
ncbi:MAG: response regulator [Gammaproteobacteria bacterium]|nr:response regulator [Gammaproteobacteria bacterium]